MGNGEWEVENQGTGNGNGKSKIIEIVVHGELNFFTGYFDIFWKRFVPK